MSSSSTNRPRRSVVSRQHRDPLLRAARIAALIHGILDIIAAIVLFIAPERVINFDPGHSEASYSLVASRIIAAALLAIGITSARHFTVMTLRGHTLLLELKLIWSGFVWTGTGISIMQWSLQGIAPAHFSAWLTLAIFFIGFLVWLTLRVLIARRLNTHGSRRR